MPNLFLVLHFRLNFIYLWTGTNYERLIKIAALNKIVIPLSPAGHKLGTPYTARALEAESGD